MTKNKLFIFSSAIFVFIIVIIICVICFVKNLPPKGSHILDVEIVNIIIPDGGKTATLTFLNGGKTNGAIIREDTRIYSSDGVSIKVADLLIGQNIRLTVGPDVFYEPYDTFIRTYKIEVLPKAQ